MPLIYESSNRSHLLIASLPNAFHGELPLASPNVIETNNMTSLEVAMSPELN